MAIRNKKNRKSRTALRSRKNHQAIAYDTLEPKLPLTTFVVTSPADGINDGDGLLTLAEAVQAANTNTASVDAPAGDADGDVIQFDPSLASNSLFFSSELTITDDLIIQGSNQAINLATNRMFSITTDEAVSVSDLTLFGGEAFDGGAISSTGGSRLVLANVTFLNNVATSDTGGGGAIYNDGGTLIVNSSTFENNDANGESGSGGAIFSESGTVLIIASEFYSNSANRAGGAIEVVDGEIRIFDSQVGDEGQGNVAGPEGSDNPGNGGGLHISGVARTVIDNSDFEFNIAASEGGGLWNQAGSTMVIRDSNIADNTAEGAAADEGGGGIFNNGGDVSVSNSILEFNFASGAAGSGGGVFSTDGRVDIENSEIEFNSAARAGGGVEIIDGNLFITRFTTFLANDAGINVAAAPGNGGGLHVSGVARTVIDDSDFDENTAASEGGGIWNQVGSTILIRNNSTIVKNVANGDGADEGGGGIFNNGGRVFIADSMIFENVADGAAGSGGGIFSTDGVVRANDSSITQNSARRAGGGVEVIDGRIVLTDSLLNLNDAGVVLAPAAPGNGGGLHVTGANAIVVLDGTRVVRNMAANEGGGLWNQTGSRMILRNDTRISSNSAIGAASTTEGGGVYNKGQFFATDSLFAQNSSTGVGGGLVVTETGFALVNGSRFGNNTAGTDGGGVSVEGRARLTDNVFAGNAASGDGGGIFESFDARTFQDGNTFSSNVPNTPNDTAKATA